MFVRFGVPDSLCYKPRQLGGGLPWNEPGTIPHIYHLGQGDRVQRYLAAPNSQYTISVSSSVQYDTECDPLQCTSKSIRSLNYF